MTDVRNLTFALGGRWHGHYGTAPCPICQPERNKSQNALTLAAASDGRLLAHCKKAGCSFRDLLRAVGLAPGDFVQPDPLNVTQAEAVSRADAERRSRQGKAIWGKSTPLLGTLGEAYLRSRSLNCDLPPTLRFHRSAFHGPSAQFLPAVVALVEGLELPAIHRTWLRPDGSGKAEVQPNKTMLGKVLGGAVLLTPGPGPLVVAEGIETALSLACGLLDGPFRLWAALSASGLRSLRLPPDPGTLIIATDGDAAGRSAGLDLASRAFALGWKVSFCHAPEGRDWNDILMMKGA